MRGYSAKCLVTIYTLMVFDFDVVTAQFKILGLLDANMGSDLIDSASPLVKISSFADHHQSDNAAENATTTTSNGQARGFSVETLDKTAAAASIADADHHSEPPQQQLVVTPERAENMNVIKVRIMEDPIQQIRAQTIVDAASHESANIIINGLEAEAGTLLNPSSSSLSNPDIKPKPYSGAAFQPNIRKFAYVEERSFHQNGKNRKPFDVDKTTFNDGVSPNGYSNFKSKKVIAYRNHYKSRCRCERIWNCPKIQITIHRCQQDYFMCCF